MQWLKYQPVSHAPTDTTTNNFLMGNFKRKNATLGTAESWRFLKEEGSELFLCPNTYFVFSTKKISVELCVDI